MRILPRALVATGFVLVSCSDTGLATPPSIVPPDSTPTPPTSDAGTLGADGGGRDAATGPRIPCTADTPLTVRFYDAGQALSVLLTLPDGRHVLVDAGENPNRPCTGCSAWHQRVMDGLKRDLGGGLDALWITHQHSDHVGGAEDVLNVFKTAVYVDNGLDIDKTAGVRDARSAAASSKAAIHVVDPQHPESPITDMAGVKFTPILPTKFPSACPTDPNACSIALRVDYCKSSVLFTGDATLAEESAWDLQGEVTLLQVSHHGSDTSTGTAFLAAAKPKYAVISAGKPGEGTNDQYCHPSASVVGSLTEALGGPGSRTIKAFQPNASCTSGSTKWNDVPANDNLWLTARDGEVSLKTIGDGTFAKE